MRFVIQAGLPEAYATRWSTQFVAPGRDFLESIWRRSEDAERPNDPKNRRRRMIHVIDQYDMLPDGAGNYDFAITNCYLWLCSTLPRDEMDRYIARILTALAKGSWDANDDYWQKDDLRFSYTLADNHPEDTKAGRDFGKDYQTIECRLVSQGFPSERVTQESPWAVYNTGVRTPGKRTPDARATTDMREIVQYLPAQIELGGGASLELGIPPLNYFHTAYNLYTKDSKRFAYGDTDDLLANLLPDPETFYVQQAALPYARALTATPNYFYQLMAKLHQEGMIDGPVITNNFDGICSLVGLPELYVRKYDEAHIVPDISFAPTAKSLLVIGSHADRRRIQQAAKAQGLKVIYVDPEEYVDHHGRTIPYPLEKLESDDILVPLTANEFAKQLSQALSAN